MQVRVAGRWMDDLAPWGDLSYSSDEHGCAAASWAAYFAPGVRHPAMRRGALVEVLLGPVVIWSGFLDEIDWAAGTFQAKGYSFQAENFPALDGSGNASSTPSVAVDAAIGLGWNVTRDASVPTTAFTTTADGSKTVGNLLDANSDELGHRWSVRADRVVRMEADTSTPTLMIRAGVVSLGIASDDYASAIIARYDTGAGFASTPAVTDPDAPDFGPKILLLDLTELGTMTQARAEGYAAGILAKGAARLGWLSAIEVTPAELRTMGDTPADLATTRAGHMVRIFAGHEDLQYLDGRTYLDVVIGSTQYAGGDRLTIGPMGSVVQTLAEAIAALTEEAAA